MTSEVLGAPGEPFKVNPKWQRHYQHLIDLHSHILSRKDSLIQDAQEDVPTFSLHMADAGTDNYDRDFALSMISSEQAALYEIEEAITRIKDGTYGICQVTGQPIELKRLDAIPWTRFSAKAEAQLEREGVVQRTRLNPSEEVPKTESAEEPEEQ